MITTTQTPTDPNEDSPIPRTRARYLEKYEVRKVLVEASTAGHLKVVESLLEAGAMPDITDARRWRTALYAACRNGHHGVATALLRAGASVNSHDASGRTPLHAAAKGGSPDLVMELLVADADIEARTIKAETPLHLAAQRGSPATGAALIDLGANINSVTLDNWTPLGLACLFGREDMVEMLLNRGADWSNIISQNAATTAGVERLINERARAAAQALACCTHIRLGLDSPAALLLAIPGMLERVCMLALRNDNRMEGVQ
jgi:ankyrin repeat protein